MTRQDLSVLLTKEGDDAELPGDVLGAVEDVEPFEPGTPEYAKIEQWIEALRSGKFGQTTNYLYRGRDSTVDRSARVGYCCLGVYCAVVNHAPLTELSGVPMPRQVRFAGSGALVFSDKVADFFAHLNDSAGFTFKQIADVAEVLFLDKETAEATV